METQTHTRANGPRGVIFRLHWSGQRRHSSPQGHSKNGCADQISISCWASTPVTHYFTDVNTGSQTWFSALQFTPDSAVTLECDNDSGNGGRLRVSSRTGRRGEEQMTESRDGLLGTSSAGREKQQKRTWRYICGGYLLFNRLLRVKRKCYCCIFPRLLSGRGPRGWVRGPVVGTAASQQEGPPRDSDPTSSWVERPPPAVHTQSNWQLENNSREICEVFFSLQTCIILMRNANEFLQYSVGRKGLLSRLRSSFA